LQGVCSPFFLHLAHKLKQDGHEVIKVNFNSGDSFYWRHDKAYAYRGRSEDLGEWIAELWRRHHVTDQVLFGDRRPVHRDAVLKAEYFGIRTHVFEEGYFRPFWVTLEREGVNGHSLLPRDPDWFRKAGRQLDDAPTPQRFKASFWERALLPAATAAQYRCPDPSSFALFQHAGSHPASDEKLCPERSARGAPGDQEPPTRHGAGGLPEADPRVRAPL
jgi:capsule polysaccharide modification protein KpsS